MKKVLLVLVALGMCSCAATDDYQAPRLQLVSASMMSGDVFSQQFRVRLLVENPNARALPVKSLEYNLYLEGDNFAEGTSLAPFTVPANGDTEFDLTVQTNFVSSIGRLLSRLTGTNRTSIEYVFAGTVVVDAPFSPKLKFNESGVVNLSKR